MMQLPDWMQLGSPAAYKHWFGGVLVGAGWSVSATARGESVAGIPLEVCCIKQGSGFPIVWIEAWIIPPPPPC